MSTTTPSLRRTLLVLPATLAAFCWICGVVATIISSQVILEKILSARWPQVTGTVKRLSVNLDDPDVPYVSFVEASFIVDDVRYIIQESLERTAYSQSLYQQRLGMGDTMTIYYDPADPRAHSILDREISAQMGLIGALSALLLVVPGLAFSFLISLTQPLTPQARIVFSLRLFASLLLTTSGLVGGMDRTSWLVFLIPAIAILLLFVWSPVLIRRFRGMKQTS
jgi:hypothetical protein